jgi:hypothetical protein
MSSESLRTDVLIEGAGVRRDVDVTLSDTALLCDDWQVPYGELFWVSRRKGMLLLFSERVTLAIQGTSPELDDLYKRLTERVNLTELRRQIVRQIGHEVVLFTAGCAIVGTIRGKKTGGLFLAVVTRRALYLLSRNNQLTVTWPARAAKRRPARKAGSDEPDDYLVLARDDTSLTVRYLFPEELGAVLYAASQKPDEEAEDRSLELFSRGEVSPPPQAELPPFSLAAGSLPDVAERAAANIPGDLQTRLGIKPYFFEAHFQELGEIVLGPLLLRKSAATKADSLERAIEAMNSSGLQEDTRAAVATAADRVEHIYDAELKRVTTARGANTKANRELELGPAGRSLLQMRMQGPFDRLWERFGDLVGREQELRDSIVDLEAAPPDEDDSDVHESAEEWRAIVSRLDSGYEGAWREMVEEIERTWSTDLLPRLGRVDRQNRARMPEWIRMLGLAFVTFLVAAVLVFLLIR